MKLLLENIGKRFNKEWVFRGINEEISKNNHIVVKGSNGSGKSTLLKIISGYGIATEGRMVVDDGQFDLTQLYKKVSISAPYIDVPEEFSLEELVRFHASFKTIKIDHNSKLHEVFDLPNVGTKMIRDYSSGMRQRVKLGLAIYSNSPILLLDEPLSNLDEKGMDWYSTIMKEHIKDRIVLVCSNNFDKEFFFCEKEINIENELKSANSSTSNLFNVELLKSDQIFHIDSIKKTCIDYRLRFLDTKYFKNEFPQKFKAFLIRDLNEDGEWTTGDFNAGLQPEIRIPYQEELEIRANWELDLDWIYRSEAINNP